ncbi:serine/threonine-protein kinase [Clostridium sp. CF012]|uniref:serine/threonine-protein kinase n=1 Tax=Clostridium sp. CF012 TaxID=2843319 RepID=UPI001C0B14D5|nr:protein kinase [Clostridium sp. CF012]MBU3145381.1 protein kinase [Clostridium sp. CF012]
MLNPGQILESKYEIIKILGRGGMGTVYLCKNNRLGNLWAVKEVNSQCKNEIDFLAEPNILKNLNHKGIVRIIDIFYENDNLYIVEDYIEGKTLKEHVSANGALSSELVTDIALQLCSILGYLHSFNPPIVYRDLKPSNIMIKPNNKVVLIDFGIARSYKEGQEGDTMILGSIGYIAPEQLENVQSNAQTDIYSLGATMVFMLTGKSIIQTMDIINEKNYPENTPKSLIKVIQKASAKDPKSRYRDIKLMVSGLSAIIADKEYTRTMFMNSQKPADEVTRNVLVGTKKSRKLIKLLIIAVFACIIALVIFLTSFMINKASVKKAPETATPKTVETTKPKEVVGMDTPEEGTTNDLDNVKEQLKDLLNDYTSYSSQAIDTNNISLIVPYVASGSEIYKAQRSYIPNTYKAGIHINIISANITDYNISGDKKSGSITTSQVYNIITKDGTSSKKTFKYVYEFKYNDSTSSYQFVRFK